MRLQIDENDFQMSSLAVETSVDADGDGDEANSCLTSLAGYDGDLESEACIHTVKRRRRHRRQPAECTECTWIQRIFSNTPYAAPLDTDVYPVKFPSVSAHQSLGTEAHTPKPLLPARAITPLGDSEALPADCKSMMAGTLMDTLNVHKLDDDVLAWGLATILNNLLKDSYNVQATYRAYSFNHPVSSDAESQSQAER